MTNYEHYTVILVIIGALLLISLIFAWIYLFRVTKGQSKYVDAMMMSLKLTKREKMEAVSREAAKLMIAAMRDNGLKEFVSAEYITKEGEVYIMEFRRVEQK